MTGFEPATPCSQSKCATKLRYIPISIFSFVLLLGSRSLVLIGNWLRFTRQVRYIPISIFSFVMGSRSLVLIENWLRFTRQVRYIPISIFSFVLLLGSRSLVLIENWFRFIRQVRSSQSQKNFHLTYGSTLSKINVKINRIKICGVC